MGNKNSQCIARTAWLVQKDAAECLPVRLWVRCAAGRHSACKWCRKFPSGWRAKSSPHTAKDMLKKGNNKLGFQPGNGLKNTFPTLNLHSHLSHFQKNNDTMQPQQWNMKTSQVKACLLQSVLSLSMWLLVHHQPIQLGQIKKTKKTRSFKYTITWLQEGEVVLLIFSIFFFLTWRSWYTNHMKDKDIETCAGI